MAPYINAGQRFDAEQNFKAVKRPGELNYLLTRMLIEGWKVAPKYSTIHKMYKDFVVRPEKTSALRSFYHSLDNPEWTWDDVKTAAALAFDEFYRRIGQVYETTKILENGDVYAEIAKPLIEKLNAMAGNTKPSLGLIVPGR